MRLRHAWLLTLGLIGCAGPTTEVPDNLRFPTGETAMLRVKATGVQIYECKAGAQDASKLEWVLRAPEAQLTTEPGSQSFGKHYAGPTWEATDGSKVVGEVRARADSPDPAAIPWLLLTARPTGGAGTLARVRSVQRIATAGGKAPPACSSDQLGQTLRVPYSAIYVFSQGQ